MESIGSRWALATDFRQIACQLGQGPGGHAGGAFNLVALGPLRGGRSGYVQVHPRGVPNELGQQEGGADGARLPAS